MSNTYTWKIEALDVKPSAGGLKDYVVTAHWRCTGTDGNDHFGDVYSTAPFQIDEEKSDYIPYDELTEEQIVEWVKGSLGEDGVTATYAAIDSKIESLVNPPIITPPLPWAPTPSAE